MKNLGLLFGAAALLVAAPTVHNDAIAGSPPSPVVVQAASLNGDLAAEVTIEDGDSCSVAISQLLNAKGKIKFVEPGIQSNIIYTLEAKKDIAILVCGPTVL